MHFFVAEGKGNVLYSLPKGSDTGLMKTVMSQSTKWFPCEVTIARFFFWNIDINNNNPPDSCMNN